MKQQCFTCSHKQSRELSKEERVELQKQHVERTGKKSLLIPEMEFKCNVSGKIIKQTDPSCEHYAGDKFMESIRQSMSDVAKKLRRELNQKS